MDIPARLIASLNRPDGIAIEYKDERMSIADVRRLAERIITLLDEAGVPMDQPVTVVARNRPSPATAMCAVIAAGRSLGTFYAFQSPQALADDLLKAQGAAVIAEAADWSPEVIAAMKQIGAVGISLSDGPDRTADFVPGLGTLGNGPFRAPRAEPGVEVLSSGTTGAPKRISLPVGTIQRSVDERTNAMTLGGTDGINRPDIVISPIAGIAGMVNVVANFVLQRSIALLDKFDLDEYLAVVKRHRSTNIEGPAAIGRMLLDADVPPEALESVQFWYGGGGPIPRELKEAVEQRYGLKLIWAYGATEFCGTLTNWNAELYDEYDAIKFPSVGRASKGVTLRVVDPETGAVLGVNTPGFLEAQMDEIGPDYIRTTDIATIDEDGFVFLFGRGDGAIIRGGFKLIPERIDNALRALPAVLDAATLGIADHRLGQVPVAAIELRSGMDAPDLDTIRAHIRDTLNPMHVPAQIRIMDKLPRTESMKPNIGVLRKMFEEEASAVA